MEWRDSVAFVTGGGQGIGLGIARALGKRGVRLVLADIDAVALASAHASLAPLTAVETIRLDVRDRAAYAAVAREIGPVDMLFNNAGIVPWAPVTKLSYDKWDLALDVNLGGVINGIQTFLPGMIARGRGGYIVNTSSGAGLVADGNPLYATAKFGVVGLSESLRQALDRHGITVSVLCPGHVDTGILDSTVALGGDAVGLPDGVREEVEARLSAGTGIDEVGEMVVAGMEARALWIHTDPQMRAYVEMRSSALLASFDA